MKNSRPSKKRKLKHPQIKIITLNDLSIIAPKRKRQQLINKQEKDIISDVTTTAITTTTIVNDPPLFIPDILRMFLSPLPLPTSIPKIQDDDFDLKQTTAPLPDIISNSEKLDNVKIGKGEFYWKFALDMKNVCIPFHTGIATRPWYEIKEDLERQYQLKEVRQQKRNLISSVFIAYSADEWMNTCDLPRNIVYSSRHKLRLINFDAHRVVQENERLVIVRFPYHLACKLYTEVASLTFKSSLTEEERIEELLNFNPLQVSSEYPPPHYRCHNCGQTGHWRKNCKSGRRMEPKGIPKMFLQEISTKVDKDQNVLVSKEGKFVTTKLLDTNKL